jgi:CubicO group peptidase (beta-lactamase class C family)
MLLGIFLAACVHTPPDPVETMNTLGRKIDAKVQKRYPDPSAPGCAVLVVYDGRVVFAKGYGVASLETGEPITPATNFRIASVTKQFTALAILQLIERGKLSLDTTLTDIFPDFPKYGADITVRHLLTHTSGLRAYEDLLPEGLKIPVLDADVLRIMKEQDSGFFPPGTKYRYSNTGYAVLAMIVESVSGQRFADYLRDEIFLPAGMNNTVAFENGRSTVPNRAYGYRKAKDGEGWEFADQSLTSSVLGDGGIYTSVMEYAKWDAALQTDRLASPETIAAAYTPNRLADGTETEYGFGWRIEWKNGHRVVHHTGSTTGFNHYVRRIPDLRMCVVVFANREGEEPKELAPAIEDLVLKTLGAPAAEDPE